METQKAAELAMRYAAALRFQEERRDKLMQRSKNDLINIAIKIGLDQQHIHLTRQRLPGISKSLLAQYIVTLHEVKLDDLEAELKSYGVDPVELHRYKIGHGGVTWNPIVY